MEAIPFRMIAALVVAAGVFFSASIVLAAPRTLSLARVRTELTFERPIDLQFHGSLAYVVEQGGTIQRTDLAGTAAPSVVLDISSLITREGFEQGLLGLALHPKFALNGYIFVNYTRVADGATVISRFTVNPSTSQADLSSELQILTVAQPFSNHNGGALVFGNDGFLYIALGDGGSGGDPQGNGQNRAALLGKILRIDIDTASPYAIPRTNPFRRNTSGFREEIFTFGMRNPFKITVDRRTGRIWAGDVGQGAQEEIDIIRRGGNYGWNIVEGNLCYPSGTPCRPRGFQRPIITYGRDEGSSVTGGYVYRGKGIRRLQGAYIYGDFISGNIWSLKRSGRRYVNRKLLDTEINISSFGLDEAKEIYIVSYAGEIYKLQTP